MGILRIVAKIPYHVIFLFKTITRSIVYHPFFVSFFIFLFLLSKASPVLFSLLVYASPIFVSTAVLIGTILTFGQYNLHKIKNRNKITSNDGFISLKTGASVNAQFGDDKSGMTRYNNGKEKEGLVKGDRGVLDFEPLINERLGEVKAQKPNSEFDIKSQRYWVFLRDSSTIRNKYQNVESKTIGSSQKFITREESSDVISDGDNSVSSNPSMTGFVPLIDESMDPLLDQISNQPGPKSQESSNYGTDASDDDTSEEEEFGDIDKDDENEEGKGSIMWSEDDRKNVANLGTIEQERNERLESVIARRRWQRLMAEKSLIDLDSSDFPTNSNVAPNNTNNNATPISAAKKNNPFDLPQIPGSAPFIVKPRSNPFDLPFHINEERSEPLVNVPHRAFPPKEMAFRRHESFSVGPSFSGENLLEELSTKEASFCRHESFRMGPSTYRSRLKPYFVPERMDFEGKSYSRASSIHETESISSDSDEESSHQPELISDLDDVFKLVEHGSESSDDEEDSFELGQSEKNKIDNEDVKTKVGVVENKVDQVVLKVPETGDLVNSESTGSPSLHVKIPENDKADGALESVVNSPTESHKEPVYDSSPRGIHKDLSSSSMSSEVDVIFPETGEPPLLVKRTVSLANRESNVGIDNNEIDGEKKPTSSENKTVVTDSDDKAVVLRPNPDQTKSSTVYEKFKQTLGEQLPSSDKSTVEKSSGGHKKLQVDSN